MKVSTILNKSLFTVLLGSLCLPVVAQNELEEIVVTARRRAETIQDAPVAITAFSASAINDANIERMEDLFQLTPNVSLATSQGIGTSFLTIRGLTQVRNGRHYRRRRSAV
ncbi:MAG: TonB-dependent receptor plug domain-containing protein [Gammaproteobacteria bacterium]|nr:TonB-dependent receptor plug domain-containing protein [Gammaproteobacteria bacterium]